MPVMGVETDEAIKKARKKRTGRESTILAERLMFKVNNPYQEGLKGILG